MKDPGEALHSAHIGVIEAGSDSNHISPSQSESTTTGDLSSVAFTRSTSAADEDSKSCRTDWARAFRKAMGCSLK